MKKNKISIIKKYFSTNVKSIKVIDTKKFIKFKILKTINLFNYSYLQADMTYNIIYFCSKYWEISNISNYVKPILLNLVSFNKNFNKTNLNYFFKFHFLNLLKKKFFFHKLYESTLDDSNFLKKNLLLFNQQLTAQTSNYKLWNKKLYKNLPNNKIINNSDNLKLPVRAFLFLWSTKNNFFVTIVDNTGNTLITWSGGNSDRTGSRQWATVFSADSAMYEACFLAKQLGVEHLSIHIRSTLRLPQVKNSFDGLEASGLIIDELVYWPLKSFGGCWKKKPRRV